MALVSICLKLTDSSGPRLRYRIEIFYVVTLVDGLDGLALDPAKFEGRPFSPGVLPDEMPDAHKELAAALSS